MPSAYLGADTQAWKEWDASELVRKGAAKLPPLLVDQGTRDKFLSEQLHPERFQEACAAAGQPFARRRGTITATTSSPPSWKTTCATTPRR